jgi:hypothetical protein
MAVDQDATSGKYLPSSAAQWTEMLSSLGLPNPSNLYLLQEAAGAAADSIGGKNLAGSGTRAYQQAVAGWTRKSIKTTANTAGSLTNATFGNVNANSYTVLVLARVDAALGAGSDPRTLFKLGDTFGDDACVEISRTPRVLIGEGDGTRSAGATDPTGAVRRYWLRIDDTANTVDGFQGATKIVGGAQACNGVTLRIGGNNSDTWMPATTDYMYVAIWSSALSDASIIAIDGLIDTGPPLYTVAGTVTIAGAPADDGEDVELFADNGDGTWDLVDTVQITGGAGAFSAMVLDNTRDYFAKYDDGANRGVSAIGTPDVDDFDVTIFTSSGAPDVASPTITVISPTPGADPGDPGGFPAEYAEAKDTPIVLELQDAGGAIAYVAVFARFGGAAERVPIFRRGAFEPGYSLHSSIEEIDEETVRLHVRADNGWHSTSIAFDVDVIDTGGNVT